MRKVIIPSLVVIILGAAFFVQFSPAPRAHAEQASGICAPWYTCPITKYYGWGEGAEAEHGNDLWGMGIGAPITALVSGTVSFVGTECWEYPCVADITWRLDNQAISPYAYVQILTSWVHVGEHVNVGQILGTSYTFIEFGLTPDYAYGVSNWRWGRNSLYLIEEARNGRFSVGSTVNSGSSAGGETGGRRQNGGGTQGGSGSTSTSSGRGISQKYTVRVGDCLSEIAARYSTTWQALYQASRLTIDTTSRAHGHFTDTYNWIWPGEVLTV